MWGQIVASLIDRSKEAERDDYMRGYNLASGALLLKTPLKEVLSWVSYTYRRTSFDAGILQACRDAGNAFTTLHLKEIGYSEELIGKEP